jgi:2-keto-4-pentenoate hydratase/2-oxohepta-3-ene-1,7-dioic acid hydratase in catechol pathway
MRLIAYEKNGQPALGARINDELVELASGDAGLPDNLDAILALGSAGNDAVKKAISAAKSRIPLAGLKYLPPVLNPAKIICVGLNYVDHVAESPYKDLPKYPVLFSRWRSTYVAHGEQLVRPHVSANFDYEGEVVAVIGKAGRYITKEKALEHIAGYSIFNDGSIRDYQFKSTQWMMGKNFDATGAFGPEFVSADEVPAGARGLQLKTRLNGETVQNANTRDMIFDMETLISICSVAVELRPGDIIISGTPSGVGFGRTPPLFMKAGDVCEIEVEGLGLLRNSVRDE